MPLTETQKFRIRGEIAPLAARIRTAAPPERAKLLREALERAGACPSWEEWDACAAEVLGDDAALGVSGALRR